MIAKGYDVVVVGSGPAGSMAGRAAALKGVKTLILEKKRDIGTPVRCAEVIPTMRFAERLNLKIDPKCIVNQYTKLVGYSPSGKKVEIAGNGQVIERKLFDMHLAREAGRAGAEIMVDTKVVGLLKEDNFVTGVVIKKEGKTSQIAAKVVIGADGFESNVARWCGLRRPQLPAVNIVYEVANAKGLGSECQEFFFSRDFAPGAYAGIVPKAKDVANVATGIRRGWVSGRIPLRSSFDLFTQHPVVSKRLEGATITALRAGILWMGGPVEKTVVNSVMLAGDAAGQAWANGEGIAPGMTCGHFAGEVAAEAIKQGDVSESGLKKYENRWKETYGKYLTRHIDARKELLDEIFRSNELIERAIDEVGHEFLSVFGARLDYVEPLRDWLRRIKQ